MKIMEELLYTEEHEWIKLENDVAYIGITDFAQHTLGDIVFVDLPKEGDKLSKGEAIAVVESVKAASDVYTPVSGEVVEVNEILSDQPELLNSDAYGNWIVKMQIQDKSELNDLMDAKQYKKFCDEEV